MTFTKSDYFCGIKGWNAKLEGKIFPLIPKQCFVRNVASYTEKSTVISAKRNLVHNLIDVSLIGFGQYNVGKYAWSRLGVKFGNTFYNNVRPCVNFLAEFGYSI